MQKGMRYIILTGILSGLMACSKARLPPSVSSSLTIVHATVNADTLAVNFSDEDTVVQTGDWTTTTINYNSAMGYGVRAGVQAVNLHPYSEGSTGTWKTPALFSLRLQLPVGSVHSLFLTGTASSPDTLFTEDDPVSFSAEDSSIGIRLVNLSPGSSPISVNLQGQSNGSEAGSLRYKGITAFKRYPAASGISSYTFEFRDAGSGTVLASYTMNDINNPGTDPYSPNLYRRRNFTLVFDGLPGGTGSTAQTAFLVKNY